MDEQHAGRACETCRLRRVKCDKRLPGCARCQKLGQPCSGYKTERRFFDDGAKVRRKFGDDHQSEAVDTKDSPPKNRTVHRSPEVDAGTMPAPGSFFNTILGDTVRQWRPPSGHGTPPPKRELPRASLFSTPPQSTPGQPHRPSLYPQRADSKSSIAQPKPLTIPATDPYANPPTARLLGNYNAYDVAADATPAPAPDEDFFDLDLDAYYANGNNACGFIPGLPVIMSDINDIDPNETDTIGDTESVAGSIATRSYSARRRVGRAEADDRGQETAMLLRHFVEIMAPWMDILDIDSYFSRIMPLKATDNVMLRSALAAVAAKRIANAGGAHDRDLLGGHMLPHSDLPNPTATSQDWFYKAASYYDKAISHLRIHLHRLAQAPPQEHEFAVPAPVEGRPKVERRESTASQDSLRPVKRRRVPQTHTRDSEIDDLLSAISVFSLYESLDNASVGFSQHLNGMQSLLEDKFRSRRMSGTIAVPPSARVDKAATAAFWNFAREDLLTAYSTRAQHTRLDPTDIALWNAAGLPITLEDFASPHMSPLLEKLTDEGGQTGREEVFVAVLIWILIRVVSLVNSEPTAPSMASDTFGTPRSAASPGSTESAPAHTQQWQNLRGLLDGWYENLPITFDPYAELDYEPEGENMHQGIKKLFYSLPLAAAALALYHFGQILLILNQPMELTQSRTPASRMRFMRAMTEESQSHARHICGIALGRPHAAVQRQLAQPLHLAGSCLEDDKDRRLVISLLQGIDLEANCVTQGLISDLYSEWGWHA